jgi:hypothetical protein
MCTHVSKCKNDTVETTPGTGGEGMENGGEGEFMGDVFDTL